MAAKMATEIANPSNCAIQVYQVMGAHVAGFVTCSFQTMHVKDPPLTLR